MHRLIRTAWRKVRVVLPHGYMLSGIILLYLLLDVAHVLSGPPLRWGWLPEDNLAVCVLMMFSAFMFGAYRVVYFHPFFQWEYGKWLQASSWTADQRLPNGPVHLVWQDLLLLGAASVLAMRSDRFEPVLIWVIFLMPYLLILAMALKFTGEGAIAFVVVMLIGGFLRAAEFPGIAGASLVGAYLVAGWGLHRSLRSFRDWDLEWWEEKGLTDINAGSLQDKARQKQLGWPFEQLSLKGNDMPISVPLGLAIAVLIGWAAHIALYYMDTPGPGRLVWQYRFLLGLPCMILALGRAIVYCNGYLPPINIWARLMTFRWIIPRYDQVFGPSLLIVLVWAFGSSILAAAEIPLLYGVPLLITLMLTLALTMPPSLDTWHLTGGHRITPQMQNQKTEMVQTQ
jgi:hypothetical protein